MSRLIKFLLFALTVCFLLTVTFLLKQNIFISEPILSVNNISYDAGIFREATTIKHVFKLNNVGSMPLRILGTKTTCNCVAITAPNQMILPGETGDLPVELRTTSIGKKTEKIILLTNDKKSPHILSITATYKPPIVTSGEAEKIDLGRLLINTHQEKQFKVFAFTEKQEDINIQSIKTKYPGVQVAILSNPTEHRTTSGYIRKEFELCVKVPVHTIGIYHDKLSVAFDHPKTPEVNIPISWEVGNRWELIPEKILFVCDDSSSNMNIKKIQIRDLKKAELDYFTINSPNKDIFEIVSRQTEDSLELLVELKSTEKQKNPELFIEISLKPQHENEYSVKIPIKIVSI